MGIIYKPLEALRDLWKLQIRPRHLASFFTSYRQFLLKIWIVHVKGIIYKPLEAFGVLWKLQICPRHLASFYNLIFKNYFIFQSMLSNAEDLEGGKKSGLARGFTALKNGRFSTHHHQSWTLNKCGQVWRTLTKLGL